MASSSTPTHNWKEPNSSFGSKWKGFLVSKDKSTHRRRTAKCKHCSQIIPSARPAMLFAHVSTSCTLIPEDAKAEYRVKNIKEHLLQDRDSETTDQTTGVASSAGSGSVIGFKRQRVDEARFFHPISKQRTTKLHIMLLQAIITSNIPFAFLRAPRLPSARGLNYPVLPLGDAF
ncbi:hypothetical protein DFS34DRAFT_666386 [Phlyctochytrium arcticum]|nr:hypothetical protein DFS34DRAFT_666386 [Phlyctochytrium arcticum]